MINDRNKLTWPEKIKLDIWYIDHWSLWLDVKILFKTIWVAIIKKEGIYGNSNFNNILKEYYL